MPTHCLKDCWVGSRISPAILPKTLCHGTHTAPQLPSGWGMWCVAPSQRDLKYFGVQWSPQVQEGTQRFCSGGIGGPALPGAVSRGRVAAPCSRWTVVAVPAATSGTAACSSPGCSCPAGTATAHAHLGSNRKKEQQDCSDH